MSRDSPKIIPSPSRNCSTEEVTASHYALKVALQTMKERCQQLQQRLAKVEEENSLLRLERCRRDGGNSSRVLEKRQDTVSLEEQVALLKRQKSQLTHHLYMVATENRQLWSRLSCLTEANQSLGSHLSKISSTLRRHNSSSNLYGKIPGSPTSSLAQLNVNKDQQGKSPPVSECKTSLDDISLKIINSFLQEKADLEQQYEQMVAIQAGESPASHLSVHSLGFSYLEEEDNETFLNELDEQCKKLRDLKYDLNKQSDMLRTAVGNIIKFQNGEVFCARCKLNEEKNKAEENEESPRRWDTSDTSYSEKVRRQLNQVAEPPDEKLASPLPGKGFDFREFRMCPMCAEIFNMKEFSFGQFTEHVQNHFVADDNDEEPCSFELISN